jgi:tetratricopeptide (TPR) repeat protein
MVRKIWHPVFIAGLLALSSGCPKESPPKNQRESDQVLAERLLKQANRLPEDAALLESAAKLFMDQQRWLEAVDTYRRLLLITPSRCDLLLQRAQAWLELEDDEAAFVDYRACLQSDPNNLEGLFALGGLLAIRYGEERTSLAEAVSLWERYLKADPKGERFEMVRRALPPLREHLEEMKGSHSP